jgi:hypothetical protein
MIFAIGVYNNGYLVWRIKPNGIGIVLQNIKAVS